MSKNSAIAIDGDSGSGKSTVGKLVAEKLGYEFIDSGLLYRAATFVIIGLKKESSREEWVKIVENTNFDLRENHVVIDGKEIPVDSLRSKDVDALVSPVSTIAEVRNSVNKILRRIASNRNVVMVGRDIGSVVLKDAFLKIYLTASLRERANRRFKELINKGVQITFEEVMQNLKNRDIIDSSRSVAPLLVAKDAYVIDTTNLSVEDVVDKILQFFKGKEYALRSDTRISKSNF